MNNTFMPPSIIIPVWNGADVITDCLAAVYDHTESTAVEVICVDNDSQDDSATRITTHYPQVQLISQPINLGFAGGINAGIKAAKGDVFILLNQDCLVLAGWLEALLDAFRTNPSFGILGALIYNPDGTINHAGAYLQRPLAYGTHLTEPKHEQTYPVESVTGAVFAIRREVWETIGPLDDDFYPAYFEETDYCYRARANGFEIGCVPQAQARHLFSSRAWQADPIKHAANQHRMRYRFVCKHFDSIDIDAFFTAESEAIAAEAYLNQAIGRSIAARDTLRNLVAIFAARQRDLQQALPQAVQRQIQVHFTNLLRQAFARSQKLGPPEPEMTDDATNAQRQAIQDKLSALRQQEYNLLTRIYFRSPTATDAESTLRRFVRLLILRPLSFLIGRDYLLLAQLNTIHVARMDQMAQWEAFMQTYHQQTLTHLKDYLAWRLIVLETLTDYDYR